MRFEGERALLRVFLDTFQKWHHRPVYEAIVEKARAEGLAGATVLAGLEGFGQSGRLLVESPWRVSNDREVVVEVVDTVDRIEAFLAGIEPLLADAVVTLERAVVVRYRPDGEAR
jgi:PII-like signaling protein